VNQGELNRLETEVDAARARLTADLDRLRAPATFSSFKSELAAGVQQTKDEWIDRTKDTINERATGLLDDLKARAAANPLAAAAIGAGLIWHFVRHPPITTLLVGLGAYGLMRTNPNAPDVVTPVMSRAQKMATSATNKVTELVDDTREIMDDTSELARSLGNRATDVAESVKNQASEAAGSLANRGTDIAQSATEMAESATERFGAWAGQKRETAAEFASQLKMQAGDLRERTTWTAINVASDHLDGILLGAAAVALVTALGVAYGRRTEHSQRTDF